MRLLAIFLGLSLFIIVLFLLFEDTLMETFTAERSVGWLKQYGDWAWAAGMLLLIADLLLPLPATLVMSALGYIYGPVIGGVIASTGSFLAGSLGYWLCRSLGETTAIVLLGQKDYERGRKISNSIGGWIVALSRWLPVFPEVIACMAGLTRMSSLRFHIALLCGSLPLGFAYAFIGYSGNANPFLAVALSAIVPPLIWLGVRRVISQARM